MLTKANKVDLKKYIGIWHQISSFPAWFQNGCKDVTAEYKPVDGKVSVLNTCKYKNGFKTTAKAKAFPVKNNVLSVSFFPLINADYIIEFVDTGYEYAVVGSTGKKYLWILARKKVMEKEVYDYLVKVAEKKGYDVSRLVKS